MPTNLYRFKAIYNIFFWCLCLSISTVKNVTYTLNYGNTNFALSPKALKVLSNSHNCRIVSFQNSPREYILAKHGFKVFSGFKPLNSHRRYAFFNELLNQTRQYPPHHLELYGDIQQYDFSWLTLGGVCKVISTQSLNNDFFKTEVIVKNGLLRNLDWPWLALLHKLTRIQLQTKKELFIYDIKALKIAYAPNKILKVSNIDEAISLMNENKDSVQKGTTAIVEIKAENNFKFQSQEEEKIDLKYTDFGLEFNTNGYSGFLVINAEAYSHTEAYCLNGNKRKLEVYNVNLINLGLSIPENCSSIKIKF